MRRDTTILLTACALVAALLAVPPAAHADEPEGTPVVITEPEAAPVVEERRVDFTRDGFFIQAQGVRAWELFSGFDNDDDAGLNVALGWRGFEMFGGDFEFEWINRFESEGPPGTADIRTYTIALMFRVYPLARLFAPDSWFNRVQPYVRAGPGWQWVDQRGGGGDDRGDFSPRFGGGFDVYITENVVVTMGANYHHPIGRVDNFTYITAGGGFQYRFGKSK